LPLPLPFWLLFPLNSPGHMSCCFPGRWISPHFPAQFPLCISYSIFAYHQIPSSLFCRRSSPAHTFTISTISGQLELKISCPSSCPRKTCSYNYIGLSKISVQPLVYFQSSVSLLVCPEAIACGANLSLAGIYFFLFFPCVIFELSRPICAKFCTMLGAAFNFIIPAPLQLFSKGSQKLS